MLFQWARHFNLCLMRGSRNFSSVGGGGGGWVQVSLTKTALTTFFLVLSLFYRSQMVNFKEIYNFQGSRGVQHFAEVGGGSPTFFQERSNCFFSIETHISCDFPGGGGSGPPVPSLDPHLCLVMVHPKGT